MRGFFVLCPRPSTESMNILYICIWVYRILIWHTQYTYIFCMLYMGIWVIICMRMSGVANSKQIVSYYVVFLDWPTFQCLRVYLYMQMQSTRACFWLNVEYCCVLCNIIRCQLVIMSVCHLHATYRMNGFGYCNTNKCEFRRSLDQRFTVSNSVFIWFRIHCDLVIQKKES